MPRRREKFVEITKTVTVTEVSQSLVFFFLIVFSPPPLSNNRSIRFYLWSVTLFVSFFNFHLPPISFKFHLLLFSSHVFLQFFSVWNSFWHLQKTNFHTFHSSDTHQHSFTFLSLSSKPIKNRILNFHPKWSPRFCAFSLFLSASLFLFTFRGRGSFERERDR